MTPDERQMLSGLFDRVRSAANGPRDQEADAFIADAMRQSPGAAYVLSQTVLVQQQALEAAAKRISDLESQARSGGQPHEEGGSFLGNLGRSLFGGGAQTPAPAQRPYDSRAYEQNPGPGYAQQRPSYAPPPPQGGGYGGGPWGGAAAPQSGGFLHSALQTATGVAGGMLAANAIEGLLGGNRGGGIFGGGFGGAGFGAPSETVNETVNNYYGSDPAGQQAQDVLQDQDQDQDAAQDAADFSGGDDDSSGGGGDWT